MHDLRVVSVHIWLTDGSIGGCDGGFWRFMYQNRSLFRRSVSQTHFLVVWSLAVCSYSRAEPSVGWCVGVYGSSLRPSGRFISTFKLTQSALYTMRSEERRVGKECKTSFESQLVYCA